MGWLKDAEYIRDFGHTWGPGIDDYEEPSDSEVVESLQRRKAYEEKLSKLRVRPRKIALDKYEEFCHIENRYLYCEKQLEVATQLVNTLGYELKLRSIEKWNKNTFLISIEYLGYLEGKDNNLHHFSVHNVTNIQDCLQLVADLTALKYWVNIWYEEHIISVNDSAKLALSMQRWGVNNDNTRL